ncbi:MAG: helix-turn-helix domain-containing protein [Deltaproteobacteria bacterium]|nr:helix-turn-helix domain-containing protein [Deltaproteobacteria bacterium]
MYGISLYTLRSWAALRKFPLYKMGRRLKVNPVEFEEWIQEFKVDYSKFYKRRGMEIDQD